MNVIKKGFWQIFIQQQGGKRAECTEWRKYPE